MGVAIQQDRIKTLQWAVIGVIYTLVIFGLGQVQQHQFKFIVTYGFAAFVCYGILYYLKPQLLWIFAIGLLARLSLVALFPSLSDDIYRFIWDGRLTAAGLNPYSYLPSDIVNGGISGIDQQLYVELNSPNYYTIYPSVSQAIFWISTVMTESLTQAAISMKLIFLIAEIATYVGICKLLHYAQLPKTNISLYWLNPLVIIEGIGNLHFEIIMITFFVWSIYFLFAMNKLRISAILLAMSVASKLLPLMFLPYLFFRMEKSKRLKYFGVFTATCFLLFLPLLFGLEFVNFGSSVDLYFQKFEFNASVYYILRYVGQLLSGYNLIFYFGPVLGLITVLYIMRSSLKCTKFETIDFLRFSLFAFVSYLLLATTVHPWYLCLPIMLSVFVNIKFVIVWSAMILLTYINYSYPSYQENMYIVALEYITVIAFLILENFRLHNTDIALPD